MNPPSEQTELAALAVALTGYDAADLRIAGHSVPVIPGPQPMRPAILIQKLAQHAEPRVREALIPLFLRHPEIHQFVPEVILRLDAPSARTLRHLYTAAV